MAGNGEVVVSWAVMDSKSIFTDTSTHLCAFAGITSKNEGYDKKMWAGIHPHSWLILYAWRVLCKTNLKW